MKKCLSLIIALVMSGIITGTVMAQGVQVTSDLWIGAAIHTIDKGTIDAVWKEGGRGESDSGDVVWGYFYADPDDVSWGSSQNPEVFVKVWFDSSGRVDVNYFHVSVPDIEVRSDYPSDGTPDQYGMITLQRRYIRQYYENGESSADEQYEDGNPAAGDSVAGNPTGYVTSQDLKIGALIKTADNGSIDAVWQEGGEESTTEGHTVLWGYFYADPADVSWGNENNPEVFVKIWFDACGRIDVNFFHVSVADIEVYSVMPSGDTYDQKGTATMSDRYIRHGYGTSATGVVQNLEQLIEQQAILKVMYMYSFTWDGKDVEGYTNLFTEDAVWEIFGLGGEEPLLRLDGQDEIRENSVVRLGELETHETRYFQTNPVFLELTDTTAKTQTMFLGAHSVHGEAAPGVVVTGMYNDEFEKTADGWKIKHRRVQIDLQP